MSTRTWCALWSAGLLSIAGCASQKAAQTPGAQRAEAAQKSSEQALKSAKEAQKKASEAQKKSAQQQQEVEKAQAHLQQAQGKAQQEQANAQQMQAEANRVTRQGMEEAQRSQQVALGALKQESERIQTGRAHFAGAVNEASGSALSVTPAAGDAMTFRITPQTKVLIDGRKGSASQIQAGSDARVAYEMNGPQPTATAVHVITGKVISGSSGGGASATSGGTGSGSASGASGSSSRSGSGTGTGGR